MHTMPLYRVLRCAYKCRRPTFRLTTNDNAVQLASTLQSGRGRQYRAVTIYIESDRVVVVCL